MLSIPTILTPFIPPKAKVAVVLGTLAVSAATGFTVEYFKGKGKRASEPKPEDEYKKEYAKTRARKDAERDAANENKYHKGRF